MRKYKIIAQDEIDALAARITSLVIKEIGHMGQVIAIPDGSPSLFESDKKAAKRRRSGKLGGKSMSDWIYESVSASEFSANEAADILRGTIPDWNNPRAADSIRTALKNDPTRFERLPNGKYKKK
jgi:hypothetical protein